MRVPGHPGDRTIQGTMGPDAATVASADTKTLGTASSSAVGEAFEAPFIRGDGEHLDPTTPYTSISGSTIPGTAITSNIVQKAKAADKRFQEFKGFIGNVTNSPGKVNTSASADLDEAKMEVKLLREQLAEERRLKTMGATSGDQVVTTTQNSELQQQHHFYHYHTHEYRQQQQHQQQQLLTHQEVYQPFQPLHQQRQQQQQQQQ